MFHCTLKMRSKGDSLAGFPVNVLIGVTFPSNKVTLAEMSASLSVVTAGQDDELRLKDKGSLIFLSKIRGNILTIDMIFVRVSTSSKWTCIAADRATKLTICELYVTEARCSWRMEETKRLWVGVAQNILTSKIPFELRMLLADAHLAQHVPSISSVTAPNQAADTAIFEITKSIDSGPRTGKWCVLSCVLGILNLLFILGKEEPGTQYQGGHTADPKGGQGTVEEGTHWKIKELPSLFLFRMVTTKWTSIATLVEEALSKFYMLALSLPLWSSFRSAGPSVPPNPVPPNRFFSAVVLLSLWWPLSSSVIIQDVDLASLTVPFGAQLLGAAANDFSGRFVSAAGDTNHDGYGDIIVGAPMADHSGRTDAGICYVLFGSSAGFASVVDLATFVTGASTGFKILGAAGSDNVGNAHSGIGDVNGDGFDDVIIGAYLSDLPGRTDAGISYVIFGRDVAGGSTAFVDVDLATFVTSPSFGFRILGAAFADYSGNFVAFAGDVNADGISDIAVGATGADPSAGSRAGISYVIFGRNVSEGAAAFIDIDLSMIATLPSIGFRILGANADDHSGSPVRTVGDVNGDGIDDLIVGAHRNDSNKGTSYVIFGRNITGGAASFGDIELSLIISEPTVGFRVLGAEVDSGNRKRHSDVKHTAQYQPSIGLSNSTIFVDSQNEPSSFRSAISLFETDRCPGRTTYKNRCMWRGGPQTWNECENYCAAQGGRLLCVDSAETNAFLLTVLPNSQFITIGLNDRSSQHNYVWSGGCSPSTYRNWESGQPDTTLERCVGIAKNGKWHDIVCNSGIECGCESSWTYEPTARPTTAPTSGPTRTPTKQPSAQPTKLPTVQPSGQPTLQPSVQPTLQPTAQPSAHPDSVQLSYFNSASDLNNDGINDIIFGAYMADLSSPARLNAGIVYVVFGRNIAAGASVFGDIELSSMMTSSSTGCCSIVMP